MKLIFKIIICLEILKLNSAVFENPFQLQALFGRVFEIDSKIIEISALQQENFEIFHKKISTFRHEIQNISELMNYEKIPKPPSSRGHLGLI